jgi:hypothetical protein
LPGTYFLPDLIVDFQKLRAIPLDAMTTAIPVDLI